MNQLLGKLKTRPISFGTMQRGEDPLNERRKLIEFYFLYAFSHRKVLPAEIAELNVHFGVFFGGLGDFSESYLSSVDNFRGCMSDV